jgi:hypothetical protein
MESIDPGESLSMVILVTDDVGDQLRRPNPRFVAYT